ncbi:MAG: formate dehydrogenase accessory sulfurtransferase FdhD [Roseiflexaceae bacterium]
MPAPTRRMRIWHLEGNQARLQPDYLTGEEPLEVRIKAAGIEQAAGVTMRTPGNDYELAVGMLYSEGVISSREQIREVAYCSDVCHPDGRDRYNIVTVQLHGPLPRLPEKRLSAGSACGVCGAAALEAIRMRGVPDLAAGPLVAPAMLYALPEKLRADQGIFQSTGGLHGAALFDTNGDLVVAREDIGCHNAVDKLIGWALMAGKLPLTQQILVVSGRAGYEIIQKSLSAGIPIVCSASAPSSLAVDLARQYQQTLIGFLRSTHANVYSGIDRIRRIKE